MYESASRCTRPAPPSSSSSARWEIALRLLLVPTAVAIDAVLVFAELTEHVLQCCDVHIDAGDGVAVSEENEVRIEGRQTGEFLLFDMA